MLLIIASFRDISQRLLFLINNKMTRTVSKPLKRLRVSISMLEKSPIKGALKNIRNTVEDILVNDPKAKYFYKDMLAADLERVISISDRYRFIEYKDPDLAELHADNLDWLENMNSHITRTHVNMLKANLEIFDRPKP